MGGCINVFLREPNGTFHRMRRWTNPVPDFVLKACWTHDPQPCIDDYMHSWYQMRDDWRKNRRAGKFEYNMTSAYFPSPTRVCFSEYGAVFLDFVTRTYLARNEYSPDPFEIMGFYVRDTDICGPDKKNAVYLALGHNRLYSLSIDRQQKYPIKSFEELEKELNRKSDDIGMSHAILYAEPPGWTIDGKMRGDMTSTEFKNKVEKILQQTGMPG